jgi:prepilin-type N-terminal cleavage/methylation domain-containing protein
VFEKLKEFQGVTIIELMIALTILALVIALAFTLQSYGLTSFTRGEGLASSQQNARYVARVFSDEVRYGQDIEIYNSLPSSGALLDGYAYYSVDNGGNVIRTTKGSPPETVADPSGEGSGYALSFESKSDGTLQIGIVVDAGQSSFELVTSVSPLNSEVVGDVGAVLGVKP